MKVLFAYKSASHVRRKKEVVLSKLYALRDNYYNMTAIKFVLEYYFTSAGNKRKKIK